MKLAIRLLPNTSALEDHLVHLEHLYEQHQDVATMNEVHKKHVKSIKYVRPMVFSKGYPVLVYGKHKHPLGEGKFKSMCLGPYIITKLLKKGAY